MRRGRMKKRFASKFSGDTRKPRRKLEEPIHIEIVNWLRRCADCEVIHIPNGGKCSVRYRKILSAMGLRPGAPDLVLLWENGGILFVEVKHETGKQSPEQKDFQSVVNGYGFRYVLVRSVDDMRIASTACGVPLKP